MAMDNQGTLYSLNVCKSEKNDIKVHVISTNFMEPREVSLYYIYICMTINQNSFLLF